MASVDDLLYEPLEQTGTVEVDFYFRMKENNWSDWYPVSKRAHEWSKDQWPVSYRNRVHGWITDSGWGDPNKVTYHRGGLKGFVFVEKDF